jgi:signal transduction histidine kinase
VRLAAWVAIGVVPVTALNIIVVLPLRDGIACMLAGLTLSATAISLMVFGTELALRPVLEDIARYLPEDFEPPAQSARLRLTMATPLVAVSLTCAITVAAYADLVSSGPWRMVLSFGIGIVSLLIGGTVIWAVVRSLRNPVDELLEATKRVRAGDLSTPVPIVTDDELGTVSSGFNRMLVELRRHERELRESRARVVAAADAARRKVERDLHDGAQQQLVVVGLKLGMARQLVERDPPAAAAVLAELKGDLDRALAELRDLAHGLYPQLLESEGLSAALGDAAGRAAITTEVNADGAGRYPAEVEAAVYFCCLEALQNAGKHAGPGARASVTLAEEAGALRFEVADDGRGFESSNGRPAGAGLANMADRIAALGGELRVSSRAGSGTTISGRIPLRPG